MTTASSAPARPDGREITAIRPMTFTPGFARNAYASVLVECGNTRILCAASRERHVPKWLEGKGLGWVTAEYDMLPGSTGDRKRRDARKGSLDGRTIEISRLIGRSLRAVVDRAALGEQMITIDCDVIDADGGTRCAAISGGFVAMKLAFERLIADGEIDSMPLHDSVAAVSVGIVGGEPRLDLEYIEDSAADVDMNVVVTGEGQMVEVQASAEGATFSRDEFDLLMQLGFDGCESITQLQNAATAR